MASGNLEISRDFKPKQKSNQPRPAEKASSSATCSLPPSKMKLKTSKDVYDMVRTDPVYDTGRCRIVYHDRVANRYMSTSLAEWTPARDQGDVPWHRVWFLLYDDVIFWDREQRCFDASLLRRLAAGGPSPLDRFLTPSAHSLAGTLPKELRIATLNLNTLEKGSSGRSYRANVSEGLRTLDADVILVQGCEQDDFDFFSNESWRQEGYGMVWTDHGLVTLARAAPTGTSQHVLPSSHRTVLRTRFRTVNGVNLEIWNVDLSPERKPTAKSFQECQTRMEQRNQLEQWTHIWSNYPAIVAGDFSCCGRKHDVGPFSSEADRGWTDCQEHQNSVSKRASISTASNEASMTSLSQAAIKGRHTTPAERVYIRSAQLVVKSVTDVDVNAHTGLVVDLQIDPSRAIDDYERLETGR